MRALLISGILLTLPLSAASPFALKENSKALPEGPKINVLLERDARSAFLEVRGSYRVERKETGDVLSSGPLGKRYVIHALQDGLRWGEEYPDIYQISIVPTHPDTLISVNGNQYKGAVSIYHARDNLITIVNEVPIEEFLKSTLALQIETPLHKEALCALAISARTEAYAHAVHKHSASRPWEITAKEAGYYGYGVTHQKNGAEKAVEWTRYMVLESSSQKGPAQKGCLSQAKAEELARAGHDAKKILQTAFPGQKLGITIDPDQVVVR